MTGIVEANGHSINASIVRWELIEWGRDNFRAFPWRTTKDPYKILISEVMLHRTQARQVEPVYNHFIEIYPDISSLVQATSEELHDILYSLGLRWRINLIYDMGKDLTARFNGQVPAEKEDLLTLPGVSEYIAGAVRCFAWNLPEPLLDTNTVRVVGRLFGLVIKESSRRNRQYREVMTTLLNPDEPRAYNYALLDLADKVCTKRQPPECSVCPLRMSCNYANMSLGTHPQ